MPRLGELGLDNNVLATGPLNAIVDVPGVAVGHYSLNQGEGEWSPGNGPYRTGVTIVLPHLGNLYEEKVPAAVHSINGFGKVFGFEQIRELGNLESAIALTGTMNVPRVADALITMAIEQNPYIGLGFPNTGRKGYPTFNPVVGETSDGYLSDMQSRPIGLNEARLAVEAASKTEVSEGSIGAGMGVSCYGWKGGIGTASRVLPDDVGNYTLGILVQSNFGRPEELTIGGVPVGQLIQPPDYSPWLPGGSIMIIIATNAPLDARQLGRLNHRAAFGLARTGSTLHGGSGDFVISFSTAYRIPERSDSITLNRSYPANEQLLIGRLGLAVIEGVEEAILNSMLMARTVVGRDGNTRHQLPADKVLDVIRHFRGRIFKSKKD